MSFVITEIDNDIGQATITSTGEKIAIDVNIVKLEITSTGAIYTRQESGQYYNIKLRDRDNPEYFVKIDGSGNLYTVSPAPEAPAGKLSITDTKQGSVSTTADSFTIIPTGEKITIQRLKAGSEMDSVAGSKVELYYAPNGDTTGIVLIDALYVNGNSDHADLNYETETGDGTKALLLRRDRLGGGGIEIFAKWEGYY